MEFKHFSHPHALSFHQSPETRKANCSGCKSQLSSGSVYSCWQCNFFLHEQCFNAARSMDHPSHPSHPLSLFPSPTYPSGSFFCNFCNLTGGGLSYSCSRCEFDLHVHCAYMPVNPTHDTYPPILSNQTHSLSQGTASYKLQYPYNTPQTTAHGNVFTGLTSQHTFPYPYISEATSHGSLVSSPAQPYFPQNEPPPPNAGVQFGISGHPISAYQQTTSINQHIPPSKPWEPNVNGHGQQHTQTPHVLPYARITEPKVNHLNHSYISANEPAPIVNSQMGAHHTKFEPPYGLAGELLHKSHPEHSLVLLPSPPYKETGEFTCNACSLTGTAFDYHCKICQFDLHVSCATLSEIVKREDHEHPLKLLFSSPYKKGGGNNDLTFYCDVCHGIVEEGCWVYYCQECDFGTHLDCVMADRKDPDENTEQLSEADSLVSAQMRLQQLQLQMQMNQQVVKMSKQNAQFVISMGQSLANLAG